MSPADWTKIEELFLRIADLSPLDQQKILDEECSDQTHLRSEVQKLIEGDKLAGAFIERPIWTDSRFLNTKAKENFSSALQIDADDNSNPMIGRRLGAFVLTKELGRGGMGAVYLAERDDQEFSQKVAIKVIKRGMDSDFIIRRFRHERQILASFEHPNIARLLDGGTTSDGLPFFVMEYIEGLSLYDYCDKHAFSITERLHIFNKIAAAVSYAHSRHIIHRDIKPGNILVNRFGSPKLLDFGIAKILDPELIHESISPTASMLRMMTPDYSSPEQIEGHDVTPESDVYSLGVLLYELLTGHRPYDLAGRSLNELTNIVNNYVPSAPSGIANRPEPLLSRYNSIAEVSRSRNATISEVTGNLRGNLDSIVMTSLAKLPKDRYTSVELMLDDINDHLSGKTISKPFVSANEKASLKLHVPDRDADLKTFAVLPFRFIDLSGNGDADERFIGLGLADALIARLSKVKRFVVRPTGSMLSFDKEHIDPIQAGKDLNVSYILDGSIKKANDRLRVSVQLLEVADNATIWATSIDETVADVLSLEDTLANKVLESLLPQITDNELEEFAKRGTTVPEAFEHYIRGRYFFNMFTEEGLANGFLSFHKAIAADPQYALAYAGIADYYNWLGIIGVLEPQDCFQNAIAAAAKAVELDSSLSDGHASLGFSLHAGNYDCERAEHHLLKAIDLNPNNANAYVWYSIVLYTQMRFDEGFAYAEKALEIDPMTPFNHHNYGFGKYFAGLFDEAERKYKTIIAEFPDYIFGYYGLSKVYRATDRGALALRTNVRAHDLMGNSLFTMLAEAECLAADGQIELAHQMIRQFAELRVKRYVSPYGIALVHVFLKNKEKTLDELELAYELRDPWLNWACVEPAFAPIRSEERFAELMQKIGHEETLKNKLYSESPLKTDDPDFHGFAERTTELLSETDATLVANKPFFSAKKAAALAFTILFLLLVGISGSYITSRYFSNEQTTSASIFTELKVVVLPFESEGSSDSNLGSGLADALTSKLGNIRQLQVLSSSTGRSVRDAPVEQLFAETGASFAVRGRIDEKDSKTFITAQLINISNGEILWSEEFTSPEGDIFALQTSIGEKILRALNINPQPLELAQMQKSHTKSSDAYELYLIGRHQLTKRNANDINAALSTFSNALQIDPEFAPALVGLADAYVLLNLYDISPPVDGYKRASSNVSKALAIDSSLAEAHATNAYIKFYSDRDRHGAELDFRRALHLNPSLSQAHHWFALFLAATGKSAEALNEINIASSLDPKSNSVESAAAMVAFYADDQQKAIDIASRSLNKDPGFVPALKVKRWAFSSIKEDSKAADVFLNEINYSRGNLNEPGWQIIALQVGKLGSDVQERVALLDKICSSDLIKNHLYTYAYEIALTYHTLGREDQALDYLELAESHRSYGVNFSEVDPRFRPLRSNPRFKAVITKLRTPRQ